MERIYVYASHTIPGAVLSVQAPTERCASTIVCAMMGELASTMGLVTIQSVRDFLMTSHPRSPSRTHGAHRLPVQGLWPEESPAEPWGWEESKPALPLHLSARRVGHSDQRQWRIGDSNP
jgi:hypothetical protein